MWDVEYSHEACEQHHDDEDYGPYNYPGGAEERARLHNDFCVRGSPREDCASVTRLSAAAQTAHQRRRGREVDA